MNIIYNGLLFIFPKNTNMHDDIYYDKCWFITKKMPKTTEDYFKIEQLSSIFVNTKYLGCTYDTKIVI